MKKVTANDGRAFMFSETLKGKAKLIGPQGGEYEFDAELLREFYKWALANYPPSSMQKG